MSPEIHRNSAGPYLVNPFVLLGLDDHRADAVVAGALDSGTARHRHIDPIERGLEGKRHLPRHCALNAATPRFHSGTSPLQHFESVNEASCLDETVRLRRRCRASF